MATFFRKALMMSVLSLATVAALMAQSVTIDTRLALNAADEANYLNWTLGGKATKDRLDAASGASVAGSTAGFTAVRLDSPTTKKGTVPRGLWGLLAFSISPFDAVKADALQATAAGKAVTVRYVHRGVAYELVTDKNGKFDPMTGARYARGLADNVGGEFVLKKEFVKAGGNPANMADLDWSKVTLTADVRDPAASRWYEGSLEMKIEKDILFVKGSLSERKK